MTVPAVSPPGAVTVDEQTLVYLGYDPNSIATRTLVLLARRYELDPLLGEIRLIDGRLGAQVYVTRDGMLNVAHRSGVLDGIVVDQQRRNSTNDGWTAYVSVWRKDMGHPFTYGAQCKDTETQAKSGNGPEMALARAERRALRRAFQIRTDFYPEHPTEEVDALDVPDLDSETVEPSNQDQAAAHRIIGALDDDSIERFLADWRIDDFSSFWPADAVTDAVTGAFSRYGS